MYHSTSYMIVAWTYEAALHCPKCAEKRFALDRVSDSGRELKGVDNEGNEIAPVFFDEITGNDVCDDCHEYIIVIERTS